MQPSDGASASPRQSSPTPPPPPPPPSLTRPSGEVPPSKPLVGVDALVAPGDMTTGDGDMGVSTRYPQPAGLTKDQSRGYLHGSQTGKVHDRWEAS